MLEDVCCDVVHEENEAEDDEAVETLYAFCHPLVYWPVSDGVEEAGHGVVESAAFHPCADGGVEAAFHRASHRCPGYSSSSGDVLTRAGSMKTRKKSLYWDAMARVRYM